jgi:hypothetical protein
LPNYHVFEMATAEDQVSIDWATATVTDITVTGQSLQLEVELEPEPSDFWTSAFNEVRPHRPLALRHHWWVNSPSHQSLTVGGVEPGSEAEVRKGLEELVGIANRQAPRDRKAHEDKQRVLQEEARARKSAAGEMTERFRSGPPD